VTVLLSAAMNAYFYVAWQVASLVTVGPMALSIALYAAGSREPAALPSRMRLTLGLALAIGLVANAVVLVGADRLLGLFGSAYAQQNALGLRILGLAVFPLIVKDHFVTLRRIQDRIAPATLIIAAGGLLEVSLAAVGAQVAGLPGVSAGYLAAACLEAVVMLPPVYRAATRREATETLAISAWGPHRAGDDPDGLVAVSRESR
jgi:Na+-driven multidrug efflux pump